VNRPDATPPSRFTNALGSVYLLLLMVVAAATIPLMILTKAGS